MIEWIALVIAVISLVVCMFVLGREIGRNEVLTSLIPVIKERKDEGGDEGEDDSVR